MTSIKALSSADMWTSIASEVRRDSIGCTKSECTHGVIVNLFGIECNLTGLPHVHNRDKYFNLVQSPILLPVAHARIRAVS